MGSGPRIITAATPAGGPSNAPVSRNVVLGVVVGAILGAALALLRENLNRAVRTPDDLEQLGLVHLGSIPREAKTKTSSESALASLEDPESPQAVAYQKVRSALDLGWADGQPKSIKVTSALQGEGRPQRR